MKDKLDFYITFYEQLAINGFRAYKASYDYDNKHIADICENGYNIAHFTKSDTIEQNPHTEVDAGTIDTLRAILKNTMEMCRLVDVRQFFTETELAAVYANAIKIRIMPDNELCSGETAALNSVIDKIESVMPELGGCYVSVGLEHDAEQGVEQ